MQLQKDGGRTAECRELTADIFKFLAQGVVKSNEWRKERVRQDLVPMYKSLCDRQASANKLFGEKLQKEIKHLKETNALFFTCTYFSTLRHKFLTESYNNNTFNFQKILAEKDPERLINVSKFVSVILRDTSKR